jgi:hypothetical protein
VNGRESGHTLRRTLALSAEDAGWSVREAAWGLEEKLLWRGSDATKRALGRVQRRTAPLQRLIETRLVWPLADALRERGTGARAGIAAAGVAAAVAAGAAGAMVAPGNDPVQPDTAAKLASATASATAAVPVLQGATPEFEVGDVKVAKAAAAAAPAELPSAPPARVAWQFADAFVRYEVGRLDERTAAGFAATATPPLAKSLSEEPPRLPAGTKVPKAKVLNVVLADRTPKQITASVSIVRLRTISEVRLSLQHTDDGWRVAGVLG